MTASPRPVAPTRLALLTALALGFAALVGIGVGALAVIGMANQPPPAGDEGGYIWPVSPTPEGMDRDTAVRPVAPAPPLGLTDQDGRAFDLADLAGRPVLISFGYTHCPDVCPATLADVRDALKLIDEPAAVVFVSIDPARDDVATMKQYVGYFGPEFIGLTGTEDEIRQVAGDWGIQYARVDTGSASGYAMAHTADAFVVDAEGRLRHKIWFGAGPEVLAARVNGLATEVLETPAPTPGVTVAPPTPVPTEASTTDPAATAAPDPLWTPATTVRVRLESTVVRAGPNRIVVTVSDPENRELAKPDVVARFTFRSADDPGLAPVEVQGRFIWVVVGGKAAYVAEMSLPRAGDYVGTIALEGPAGAVGAADFAMTAGEQSPTPPIGSQAPSVRTPVASDVGGNLKLISSDTFPDPRFYERSVDELLATGRPFVFTIYSPAFCPTTACGPLLSYMKEIASEFPDMAFVHAEPYVMRDVGGRIQPEYEGNAFAWASWSRAYGIPVEPFVFVVNGAGEIVASFELIVGTDEIRTAIRSALGG